MAGLSRAEAAEDADVCAFATSRFARQGRGEIHKYKRRSTVHRLYLWISPRPRGRPEAGRGERTTTGNLRDLRVPSPNARSHEMLKQS